MGINADFSALVVDDDESIVRLLCRALERVSIQADSAPNGVVASEMLALRPYSALITDLRMPKKHGHQLVTEVLEKGGDLPMIFVLTGLFEPKVVLDLFERGVDCIDYKPLNTMAFATKVRGMLGRRKARQGLYAAEAEGASPQAAAGASPLGGIGTSQLKEEIAAMTATFESAVARLKAQQSQLEEGFVGSLRVLTGLVSNIGKSNGVHVNRVERMAGYIGERLGMDQDGLRNLRVASLLHEIGQFGMPDTIRGKAPWQLPAEIREQYELYPTIGATLLSEMPGTGEVVRLIECHAENYNGTGFPKRLSGDAIPLGARVIRLADAYDTYLMYSEEGQGRDEAIQYLAERRGKFHDPDLFSHAMAYIEELAVKEDTREVLVVGAAELREGMQLAENVYDGEGRFLAREGVKLSRELAERLRVLMAHQTVRIVKEV